MHHLAERLLAVAYGGTYDAVVTGFPPYEALLGELLDLVARSSPGGGGPQSVRILDVACGTGTVAFRLARAGYAVLGVDPVAHLIQVARQKRHRLGTTQAANVSLHQLDAAREAIPGTGTFDVVLSMHTLYWHDDPDALLMASRRALKPGGHGIFLTYAQPAHVLPTARQIWTRGGFRPAVRALRWLVPTAVFERLRRCEHRYLTQAELHHALVRAGFEVLESRRTFLAEMSLLAWTRTA